MLMAAGLGTRLLPFTSDCPKALIPLLGVPIAQFALDQLEEAWIQKVVINLHHLPEVAQAGLMNLNFRGMKVEFSDEREELLGSAGGIARALPRFKKDPFFLLNADVLQDVDLQALARVHQESGAKLTLALTRRPKSLEPYREIRLSPRGQVIGYGEKKSGALFYTGVGILDPSLVDSIPSDRPSDFVREILDPAIQSGVAYAYEHTGIWMDLGSPQLWVRAHIDLMQLLESGNIPERIRVRVAQESVRVHDGFWISRSFSQAPVGEFENVYLGNALFRGNSARQSVWYGNLAPTPMDPKHSWIAHGRFIQALN